MWGPIKKKVLAGATGDATTPSSSKAKGSKNNAGAGEDNDTTPSKKPGGKGKAAKAAKATNTGEEAQDDDVAIKTEDGTGTISDEATGTPAPKATPKKRASKAKATPDGEEGSTKVGTLRVSLPL